MSQVIRPWQILVATFVGRINEHRQAVIDHLREKNRVLAEQLDFKRLLLADDQRRRLAARPTSFLGEANRIVTSRRTK